MRIYLSLSILLAACTSSGGAPAVRTAAPAAYDVHEWGLVRALAGDMLSAGAIAPPMQVVPLAVDKPVLYFHADAPMRLTSVSVDGNGGAIVEAWPVSPRTNDASQLSWRDVAIDPGGACEPSPLPVAGGPGCAGVPDQCETASLAQVRVPGSACLRVGSTTDSLLFYRTRTNTFTPPLRFERRLDGQVEITNERDAAIPGWLVYIVNYDGMAHAVAMRPPAPQRSITMGPQGTTDSPVAVDVLTDQTMRSDPEPGRHALRDTMHEIGLSDGEVDAFMRAWDPALFAMGAADVDRRGQLIDGLIAPTASFVYFLPASDCERIARLTFDPPPRHVQRAIAVWSASRSAGVTH